jgi:AcrR family transcriptional regulator
METIGRSPYSLSRMPRRPAPPSLDPKKTPAQARAAATVEAVLDAAAHILEIGPARYTTNAIARRAGVSIGSLYQYFACKDAITKALILRQSAALLADLRAIDTAAGRAGLERLLSLAVDQQLRRPALARILDEEEARLPLDAELDRVAAAVIRAFQRCLDAPDLASRSRGAHVAIDLVAIVKALVDAAGERGDHDAAALLRRVRRAVFGYLDAPA